ncbi:hypothetical protein BKA58DRAFT_15301 [Alternaria rosae]|uniref:uncharacterized protein n=1 Tax=Alternaria rosae TaxID=1187941 RepID=UPI001E8D9131|nr:uncharacterized protein BKA58DRAFT_15301 [Alternaria rosae]KAH6882194.1 hypothetical protein BKA58DRAFT_15301 [Alternaria rosae]
MAYSMRFTTFCMGWALSGMAKGCGMVIYRTFRINSKGNDGGGRGGNTLDFVDSFLLVEIFLYPFTMAINARNTITNAPHTRKKNSTALQTTLR